MPVRTFFLGMALMVWAVNQTAAQGKRPGGGGGGPVVNCSSFTLSPLTSAQLQTALDCAVLGDTISLAPSSTGVVYEGSFQLPNKVGDPTDPSKVITIRTSALEETTPDANPNTLPAPGRRVSPTDQGAMAWLRAPVGSSAPVVSTLTEAHHYKWIGVKFSASSQGERLDTLVLLGAGSEGSTSDLPHHVSFDRCYFAGSPSQGAKRGLTANAGRGRENDGSESIVVRNSYFENFKDLNYDAQAIVAWNGWGPFHVENNYLEASGENVMFGGGDPSIGNLIPSDITILRNHFYKPLGWVNQGWKIKNLFELKNAQRVIVQGNVFENNWIAADQHGFAIVFTPRNQGGRSPWSSIQDVTFQNNLIRNSVAGFNLLGSDTNHRGGGSGPLKTVRIMNNLMVNIRWSSMFGTTPTGDRSGRLFQFFNGPQDVQIRNNTAFQTAHPGAPGGGEVSFSTGSPDTNGFLFTDNVIRHNTCTAPYYNNCGISGDGTAPGNPTLQEYFTGTVQVTGNVMYASENRDLAGNLLYSYPGGNQFPLSVGFESTSAMDLLTGLGANDYDIQPLADGSTPGVNWDNGDDPQARLKTAISGVVQTCSEACSQ